MKAITDIAPVFDRWQRTVAAAAAGDSDAIARLAESPEESRPAVVVSRMGGVLHSRALQSGLEGEAVQEWADVTRATVVRRMVLDQALAEVGEVLDGQDVSWLPLKGMGLPEGTYHNLAERPTSDLDILVPSSDFHRAVGALRRSGWSDVNPHPLSWQATVEEGYNWQAVGSLPAILELHFRFWGSVPEAYATQVMERAKPAGHLGQRALTIDPADAALIAAVHVWQTPVPRPLLFLWDLHRLMEVVLDDSGRQDLLDRAGQAGLQLYLVLSLLCIQRLWPTGRNDDLARRCLARTGPWERRLTARAAGREWDRISLGAIVACRLLDRRPSRTGWRAPLRALWPHPGILVNRYPHNTSRIHRRLRDLARVVSHPATRIRKR